MSSRVTIKAISQHSRVVACPELGAVVYATTETSARTVRRLMNELLAERETSKTLRKMLVRKTKSMGFANV